LWLGHNRGSSIIAPSLENFLIFTATAMLAIKIISAPSRAPRCFSSLGGCGAVSTAKVGSPRSKKAAESGDLADNKHYQRYCRPW
jgi:hypothetical protein